MEINVHSNPCKDLPFGIFLGLTCDIFNFGIRKILFLVVKHFYFRHSCFCVNVGIVVAGQDQMWIVWEPLPVRNGKDRACRRFQWKIAIFKLRVNEEQFQDPAARKQLKKRQTFYFRSKFNIARLKLKSQEICRVDSDIFFFFNTSQMSKLI